MAAEPEYEEIRAQLSVAPTPAGMSRRRFLQAALASGVTVAASRYLSLPAWAASPVGPDDGILVVITMAGGNDAMNMLVPYGDSSYYGIRQGLAIPQSQVIHLDGQVGLHPKLPKLKGRYDAGQVAIVQGVGYDGADMSHFSSMATWMSATLNPNPATGWLGRYTDGLDDGDLRGVMIGTSTPLHLIGAKTVGISLPTSLGSAFGGDRSDPSDARMFDALSTLGASASGIGPWGDAVTGSGRAALEVVSEVSGSYNPALPDGSLNSQMILAARLINANLGVRVIGAEYGSFDTHTNELVDQGDLLGQLDDALDAFWASLDPRWAGAVTVATFSEFGRRVEPNKSNGFDHGTAGAMLVMGPGVKGGLHGSYPSLVNLDDNGNLVHDVDFRSVYTDILDTWLAADGAQILGASYPALGVFAKRPHTTAATGKDMLWGTGGQTYSPPPPPTPTAQPGYCLVSGAGTVTNFNHAGMFGGAHPALWVVGAAGTPSGQGCWLVCVDGAVEGFGDAKFHGSLSGTRLNAPIVAIARTPSAHGYWLLGADGGVFSYGDAVFHGSTGNMKLNKPVVSMAAVPSGAGYWFVASDGGIFAFGPDAKFYGSTGNIKLNQPVVSMAATPTGKGYWLVARDGGIFAFGDAKFYGSTGGTRLNKPIVDMLPTPTGQGYWLVASDGGIFAYGDATFQGSLGANPPAGGVVAIFA